MAIIGLKGVKLALVDQATQKIIKGENGLTEDGIYVVDKKDLGTRTANITNLQGAPQKIDGDDQVEYTYTNPSSPSVAFTFNNLFFDIKQKLLGRVSDGKGGYTDPDDAPVVAVLIESTSFVHNTPIYFGFGAGQMSETTQNIGTNTNTAKTIEADALTYTALGTLAFNDKPYKIYDGGDKNFDEANMLKEVFGGYIKGATTESHE